jgi:TPR repeat protein
MFALGAVFCGRPRCAGRSADRSRWFRAAAELGHGHAQMMLGRYLMNGAAGDLNPVEGRMWLERAVAQGVADAEHDLAAAPATRTPAA